MMQASALARASTPAGSRPVAASPPAPRRGALAAPAPTQRLASASPALPARAHHRRPLVRPARATAAEAGQETAAGNLNGE